MLFNPAMVLLNFFAILFKIILTYCEYTPPSSGTTAPVCLRGKQVLGGIASAGTAAHCHCLEWLPAAAGRWRQVKSEILSHSYGCK